VVPLLLPTLEAKTLKINYFSSKWSLPKSKKKKCGNK
jgi:hypothetical protein